MNKNQRDQETMRVIKQSGILNPNTTLDTIFNVTQELNMVSSENGVTPCIFMCIPTGFIFKKRVSCNK